MCIDSEQDHFPLLRLRIFLDDRIAFLQQGRHVARQEKGIRQLAQEPKGRAEGERVEHQCSTIQVFETMFMSKGLEGSAHHFIHVEVGAVVCRDL